MKKRLLIGIGCAVLAFVICFVGIPKITESTKATTTIVRVKADIVKGSMVTKESIETVEVGKYNLPSSVTTDPQSVIGKYALADFAAGDYILSGKLSNTYSSQDVTLTSLPTNKIAISFSVKSMAAGFSNKLRSGDIIRLYSYDQSKIKDIPELQYVKVLFTTNSDGKDIDTGKRENKDEEKAEDTDEKASTITVLATPAQAKLIAELENSASLYVSFIHRGDAETAGKFLALQDKVLEDN